MTRVAAVDCGTNSIRLLVADVAESGLIDVVRRTEIVRLGEGVDRTGRLGSDALARTLAALSSYTEQLRALQAERVRMVATSAIRDADNQAEFVAGVRDMLGVDPEVVTGATEAGLSFDGAVRDLSAFPPPYLVVDIGGGSTEFVLGTARAEAARSVDIGCVRLTERHLHDDPPTAEQVAAAVADIEAGVETVRREVPLERAATFVGLAGSVTTVAALALGLPEYDPARIHHARIPRARVREVCDGLVAMRRVERAALPVMHPGRVDVIGAGALVLATVLDQLQLPEVVASEHDILDGIAWSLAGG